MSTPLLLTLEEKRRFKQKFSCALSNMEHIRVYWSLMQRCIYTRRVACMRRFVLPADAVEVGNYAQPFPAAEFIGDLEAMLTKSQVTGPQRVAA